MYSVSFLLWIYISDIGLTHTLMQAIINLLKDSTATVKAGKSYFMKILELVKNWIKDDAICSLNVIQNLPSTNINETGETSDRWGADDKLFTLFYADYQAVVAEYA